MSPAIEIARLGDPEVADVILGQSPPSTAYNEQGEGPPFYQGKADFGLVHPTPRVWCTQGVKFAKADDVLMSVRAPVGDVNMATEEAVIGRGVSAIRAASGVDPWFLYFALAFMKPALQAQATGSTFASVNGTTLRDLEIPFAPFEDQVAIGRALRLLVTQLQGEDIALKATEATKAAAMQRLFSCGLRGEVQKETEIGPIPESWELRALPEMCDILSGGTPKKSIAEYWSGDIPWVSGKDLKRPSLDDATDHLSQSGVDNGSRLAPADAVLLLVRGMGLARDLPVAVITRPMAFNQDVKALVSKYGFSGSFLRSAIYAGKDRLLSRLATSAHGTKTLNLHDLSNFFIPVPPTTAEAHEVASVLEIVDRKADLHRRKREVLDQIFKSLLHGLMTGNISVEDLDLEVCR